MGKRGPRPVATELPYWEKEWYWHFKGMRDGIPGVDLDEPLFELRKLSMHPALLDELQNEPRIRVKMARTRLRGVPPERDLLDALLQARTPKQVRTICRRSRYWLNPRWGGRVYVKYLYDHADQFLRAKDDPRYPRSTRPSSYDKRLRFLARAMAGITLGRRPRTAIDLLAKKYGSARRGIIGKRTKPTKR